MPTKHHRQDYYSKKYGKLLTSASFEGYKNHCFHIHSYLRSYFDKKFCTLVTEGISDFNLPLSKGSSKIELLMYVPATTQTHYDILQYLTNVILVDQIPLGVNETISSPTLWWKQSLLQDFFITQPIISSDHCDSFSINDSRLNMYWAIPITRMERDYKAKHGAGALLELFSKNKVPFILDENRKSTILHA